MRVGAVNQIRVVGVSTLVGALAKECGEIPLVHRRQLASPRFVPDDADLAVRYEGSVEQSKKIPRRERLVELPCKRPLEKLKCGAAVKGWPTLRACRRRKVVIGGSNARA